MGDTGMTFSCPECDGDGGAVGESFGRLVWIECGTCDGDGVVQWDVDDEWEEGGLDG